MVDLDKLDALHKAATQGEWGVWKGHASVHNNITRNTPAELRQDKDGRLVCSCEVENMEADTQGKRDARYIAAIHNTYPAMAAEIRELRAKAERLRREAGINGTK